MVFALNVLQEHCGAQQQINVSLSVDKMLSTVQVPTNVFAMLAMVFIMEFVSNALLITSSPMAIVLLAQLPQLIMHQLLPANAKLDIILVNLESVSKHVKQMRFTI
jgi:hypothetical protein